MRLQTAREVRFQQSSVVGGWTTAAASARLLSTLCAPMVETHQKGAHLQDQNSKAVVTSSSKPNDVVIRHESTSSLEYACYH